MDKEIVLNELAEELRTNVHLRHRLGMEEGCESGRVDGSDALVFVTSEGEEFFLGVVDAP